MSLIRYAAAVAVLAAAGSAAEARDHISIVGSSTVFPFSTAVAEDLGRRNADMPTPVVESTGTGGGMKLFCQGVGPGTPDITNASRRIKQSEVELCAKNGVTDIIEIKIGYDGIVMGAATGAPRYNLTERQVFLALAKLIPADETGATLKENDFKRWSEVDISLPGSEIKVYGPPPTSGTRDAFVELAMEKGCSTFPAIKALKSTDSDRFKAICHGIREDGGYLEAGENDNLIIQKLDVNKQALGIFGYSFLDQNRDHIRGAQMHGVVPTFESISAGDYPLSRPLYFYVKRAHVGEIKGMEAFLDLFASDEASGDFGFLTDKGLIPLPAQERAELMATVKNLDVMTN